MRFPTRLLTAALAGLALACAGAAQDELSRDQLLADLDQALAWIEATHPDLSHSADAAALAELRDQVEARLPDRLDRREAWLALGAFNPLFNDAHTGIALPAGAAVAFPPVKVESGRLFVADSIAADSALAPGDEILAIDEVETSGLIARLTPSLRGEADSLRERILELRFGDFLALWTGGASAEMLTIARAGQRFTHRLDPEVDRPGAAGEAFSWRQQESEAVLRIDTFDRDREEAFAAFLATAFAEIDAAGADRLVIDLRGNGGGARQLSDRLMAYLTGQRYTPLSAVTARVAEENISRLPPGAEIGQVVSLPFAQWVEPPAELIHRFEGEITVLIGPDTYSQAIVFAATVQDFGIGALAGDPTAGPANQTGQVQRRVLEHTGFEARAPLYVFTRASGETGGGPLRPDRD